MANVDLKLDWCSYKAAKYAVEKWHYSHSFPAGKAAHIGVWENNAFIGAIFFGWGANKNMGNPYGLKQTEVCELTRVALSNHTAPVSKILSVAIKMVKKHSPGLRLIVSYADTAQSHVGTIYQATNWFYVGDISTTPQHFIDGRWVHQRQFNSAYGSTAKSTLRRPGSTKRKYLYPLDDAMRKQIEPLRKPYPKRADEATEDADGDQP